MYNFDNLTTEQLDEMLESNIRIIRALKSYNNRDLSNKNRLASITVVRNLDNDIITEMMKRHAAEKAGA